MTDTNGRNRDLTPADVIYLLRQRGLTLVVVDLNHGLKPSAARHALRAPHHPAELAIAQALDMHPAEIWPSRYGADGARLKPQPRENYTSPPSLRSRQKRSAA
jgi:Ner family transcriptional regulator